ncbi:unnamed protein product [Dibothriocephalus latus]|uniref:J domain-containing protein n=1 Tax=Dibothriocephalus latus TaxID=60516 RepID=A0A3P7LGH6_DIBLA|nr:unnamed protein product [Dibothriocephalus latus]
MFANRDEALKCIRLAEKHIREGNAEAAKKFLRKAVRLDPSVTLPSFTSRQSGDSTPPRQRSPSRSRESPSSSARENSQERNFSKANVEAVRSVLSCKDLYKVLGVSKDASEDEIKRAYKGLARKFHPDKNRAPGATEAFKKIGSAFSTLTNAEKRRRYDLYGSVDEPAPSVTRQRHGDVFYQFDGHPGFDADVFNIFFNGGFPFVYRNHRAQTQHQPRESEREVRSSTCATCIIFMPSGNYFAVAISSRCCCTTSLVAISFSSSICSDQTVFLSAHNPLFIAKCHLARSLRVEYTAYVSGLRLYTTGKLRRMLCPP